MKKGPAFLTDWKIIDENKVRLIYSNGKELVFEKIIIMNGVMIAFFITNPLSQYYRSDRFSKVLEKISQHPKLFEVKQPDGRLRIMVRNVDGISKAYDILKML